MWTTSLGEKCLEPETITPQTGSTNLEAASSAATMMSSDIPQVRFSLVGLIGLVMVFSVACKITSYRSPNFDFAFEVNSQSFFNLMQQLEYIFGAGISLIHHKITMLE